MKVLGLSWIWATNKLAIEELKDKLSLAKICKGSASLHVAVRQATQSYCAEKGSRLNRN